MKKIIKWFFTILGIIIFVYCIGEGIDGVGRFACIVFASLFTVAGSALK